MIRSLLAPLLALFVFLPASAYAEVFWKGTAAGYAVVWDESDLRVVSQEGGRMVFSAKAQFEMLHQDRPEKPGGAAVAGSGPGICHATETIRLMTLVGPYLGYRQVSETSCPGWAHPSGEVRFRTLDLRRAKAGASGARLDVSLDDLFAADAVSKALRKDRFIAQAGEGTLPQDLGALVTELSVNAVPSGNQCFRFPKDALSRFAVIGYQSGRALVRIGLPGAGPCRMALTQLGLELRPPAALAAMLLTAQAGRAGVLDPAAPGAETVLSVSFRAE